MHAILELGRYLRVAVVGAALAASAPGAAVAQAVASDEEEKSHAAVSDRAMVATVSPWATDAALKVLEDGGNAIDAAVAAALMLGVVDGYNSGIGGGCLMLIRLADGTVVAIDGREMAPATATRDMYLSDGRADTELSQTGPLAVATPGALAAYDLAVREHGKKRLAELLAPAADRAAEGFKLPRQYAQTLRRTARVLRRFEGSRAALLKPDGSPYAEGELLKQPDLAATYRSIAEHGVDWFYRGPFAEKVGQWMAENGGVLTSEDFALYEAKVREPIVSRYRGYTVIGFPPPSSGGIHVAQMLNMLQLYDLGRIHREDPLAATHLVVEVMKRAFADRAYWLGDADFVRVPLSLTSPEYAAELAAQIDLEQATDVETHGTPPGAVENPNSGHTTHMTLVDSEGNWVALTATVNTSFGSKVIVPGTGVPLNNEMDDFSAQPGVPNAFGLIGGEKNAVEAGKRPLSSMSPTIVLDPQGEPFLTVGAAGGPKIITQVLLAIIRSIDYGMPLPEAVATPRFHHQWRPESLGVERATPGGQIERLESFGHQVESLSSGGVTQAIRRDAQGRLIGVHDPRVQGKAAGL